MRRLWRVAGALVALSACSTASADNAGELIPPLNIVAEASDPTTGLEAAVAEEVRAAEVRAYLDAVHAAEHDRRNRARPARRQPPDRASRARSSAGAGGSLAAIRACESGGNYGAVSASGKYTGAYQFDEGTWRSVGGTGRAGDASPAEQDARAAELMRRRGTSPWPKCGR